MGHRRLLLTSGWMLPPLLAVLFALKGQRFDPAYITPSGLQAILLPVPSQIGQWRLEGGQLFPAERMFEKINGKAGYYLQYRAVELCSGEWVSGDRRWDMYLYRFKDSQGARYAFTGERAGDATGIGDLEGYRVPGQVAVLAGPFYLQLNALKIDADTLPAEALARKLVAHLGVSVPADGARPDHSLASLAGHAMLPDSERLLPEGAFGFSVLHDVHTVRVSLTAGEATWYTAPGDASTLAAYREELKRYGGEQLFEQEAAAGGLMFSSWQIAGVVNGALWGVQAAPSREALLAHWETLLNALQERRP